MGRRGRGDGKEWEGRLEGEMGMSGRGYGKEWEGRWEGVGGEMGGSGRGEMGKYMVC